jgi:cobalt-zinc-cadmium efflux system protein
MSGGHGHSHAAGQLGDQRRPVLLVLGITLADFLARVVGTLLSGSLALLADAGHLLTDAMGLVFALVAATLMTRASSTRRTWGFVRAEALSAAAQAVILTVARFVIIEGTPRMLQPPPVASSTKLAFGVVGLLGNAVAIGLLLRVRTADLNLPETLDAVQHCGADHVPVSIEHSTFQFEPLSHVEHERATHA